MSDHFLSKKVLGQFRVPVIFVLLMWGVHFLNYLSYGILQGYGIKPRTFSGLWGIITAPFIHGDLQHLISNTLPMLFLLSMLFLLYRKIAWQAFIALFVSTGFMVWLFARPSYHIGASGIVYALVSFLFWTGLFRRNLRSIAISLVILFLYSSYFLGIMPSEPGISWESHLFGGIMGIAVAYLFRHNLEEQEMYKDEPFPDEIRSPYFDSDIFEMTKREREIQRQRDIDDWFTNSSL